LNLDQLPTLGAANDNLTLIVTRSGASVTQTAPIRGGARLSLLGEGASFVLTNAKNSITQFAADVANVKLADSVALTIGKVNTIPGVTATTLVLDDPAGVKQSAPITAENVLLEGTGGVFSLTNPANSIGKLAADTGTLRLADASNLVIGAVGNVSGVTATTVSLSDSTYGNAE
jgi:hypothetical protein